MRSLTKKYLGAFALLLILLASMFWFRVPWRVVAASGFLLFAALDLWYILAVKKDRRDSPTSTKWHNDTMVIAIGLLILFLVLLEHILQ